MRAVVESPSMGDTGAGPGDDLGRFRAGARRAGLLELQPARPRAAHPRLRRAAAWCAKGRFCPGRSRCWSPHRLRVSSRPRRPDRSSSGRRLVGTPTFTSRAGLRLRGESSLTLHPEELRGRALVAGDRPGQRSDPAGPARRLGLCARRARLHRSQPDAQRPRLRAQQSDRPLRLTHALRGGVRGRRGRYPSGRRLSRGLHPHRKHQAGSRSGQHHPSWRRPIRSSPAVTGGYSLRIDKGDTHFSVGAQPFQFVYPSWEEIGQPEWAAQRELHAGLLDRVPGGRGPAQLPAPAHAARHTARTSTCPRSSTTTCSPCCSRTWTACALSAYFYKDRGGPLVAGPVWDFDRSSGTPHDADFSPTPRAAEPKAMGHRRRHPPLAVGFLGAPAGRAHLQGGARPPVGRARPGSVLPGEHQPAHRPVHARAAARRQAATSPAGPTCPPPAAHMRARSSC